MLQRKAIDEKWVLCDRRTDHGLESPGVIVRIHWLQHVPFEGLGSIEDWAVKRGIELTETRLHLGHALPDPDSLDGLIVMGGPMSVHGRRDYPWLTEEHRFVETAVRSGTRVLGICLGAQILASVLGANVRRNATPEIGWFPVSWTPGAQDSSALAGMPASVVALHWHGETFGIPSGAVHVARSVACENQAFVACEGRVVGLQFHLEMRHGDLLTLTREAASDLVGGAFVQGADEMLSDSARFQQTRPLMEGLLDQLFG